MVRWAVGSIPHVGPIDLLVVSSTVPRLMKQRPRYVLSCLWDGAYKRTLAANRKTQPMWRQWVFSYYLSGLLPYVRRHITVNKMH